MIPNSDTLTPSEKVIELQNRLDELCNNEERLFRKGFNDVWTALFEIDDGQEAIYRAGGDLGITLPTKADEELLYKALAKAGYVNDDAFCRDFIEYANNRIEGKKVMAQIACEIYDSSEEPQLEQEPTQHDGWRFVPMGIIAPKQVMEEIIYPKIEADAQEGKGLFENVTATPMEDISEDEFSMVEAYECKGTFTNYFEELKKFGVMGRGDADAFLSCKFKQLLMCLLKDLTLYVNEHTDKPNQTKNYILEKVKMLDEMPIWGLVIQILVLQGLCRLLDGVSFHNGDKGLGEFQNLYDWLLEILEDKLVHFCYGFYGDGDKKRLKPLCDYLYTTEAGQIVQQRLFGGAGIDTGEPEQQKSGNVPTDEENSDSVKNRILASPRTNFYFELAVGRGWITHNDDGKYKWDYMGGKTVSLVYFILRIYRNTPPFKLWEILFDKTGLSQSSLDMRNRDYYKRCHSRLTIEQKEHYKKVPPQIPQWFPELYNFFKNNTPEHPTK